MFLNRVAVCFCEQRQWHNRCDRPCFLRRSRGIRWTQGTWVEARRTWCSRHWGQQEGICQVSFTFLLTYCC